ncbi:MAG TPA: hypothetical protein VFG52_08980 [Xanthomonadales bacterium]|nr:hypothetical protein [Xanthomonadales bacterium]
MSRSEHELLLISRDDILAVMKEADSASAERMFRMLASLTRQGYHLLATAPQPEQWTGEHGSPDDALLGPDSIRKRLSDAGGKLDGVYYLRRSLLTQRRNREDALEDILRRYGVQAENCTLISSRRKFLVAARGLGFPTIRLSKENTLLEVLEIMTRPAVAAAPEG